MITMADRDGLIWLDGEWLDVIADLFRLACFPA